jgi:hypothetical protein
LFQREPSQVDCPIVSQKKLSKPAWYKNTYFWISAALLLLGFIGMIAGEKAIRDPGQKHESGLAWIYFGASVIMLVNGLISHKQTVQLYAEQEQTQS